MIFWICGRRMRRFQPLPSPSFIRFNVGEGKVGKGVATIRVARNPVAKLFSMPAAILHPPRLKAFLVSSSTFSNVSHGRGRTWLVRPSTWKWFEISLRNSLDRVDGFLHKLVPVGWLIRIFARLGFKATCFCLCYCWYRFCLINI